MREQGQKIAAAGSTLVIAETAFAAFHTGGVGALVGLAAAGVVWVITDEIQQSQDEEGRSSSSSTPHKKPSQQSLASRLMKGKSRRKEENALPLRSPCFAKMKHLCKPGRDILGFNGTHFIAATSLKQSINMGLIGMPGSGKTTCLTFHCAQAIMRGATVRGWDLHGDVAADLGSVFHILEDVEDILEDCQWLQSERDRRIALRKLARAGEKQALVKWESTAEIFYVIDEFNALILRLKNEKASRDLVTNTLLSLIAEGRKFKMRVILTGQSLPASLFGDGASGTRDNLSTRYAFKTTPRQAQTLGIDQQAIESLLPRISGEDSAGYAILDGGPLASAALVSIPLTTVEDIRELLEEDGNDGNAETAGNGSGNAWNPTETPRHAQKGNVSAFPNRPGNGQNDPDSEQENAEMDEEEELPEGLTWDILDQITQAYEAGWNAKDTSALVKLEGRKYSLFKQACDFLEIDFKVKA